MSLYVRCPICDNTLAPSNNGRREHMRRVHGVSIVPDKLLPMDPMRRAAIVARVESRLGAAIISPDIRRHCIDCGPTDREGYTRHDGVFLCGGCLGVRSKI